MTGPLVRASVALLGFVLPNNAAAMRAIFGFFRLSAIRYADALPIGARIVASVAKYLPIVFPRAWRAK